MKLYSYSSTSVIYEFLSQLRQVWQQKPYHVSPALDCLKNSYTMDNVENSVDSEFLEAGRGTTQAGMGGWNMAAVSKVTHLISLG